MLLLHGAGATAAGAELNNGAKSLRHALRLLVPDAVISLNVVSSHCFFSFYCLMSRDGISLHSCLRLQWDVQQ